MKRKGISKGAGSDLINYVIVCVAFVLISTLRSNGALSRSQQGLLVRPAGLLGKHTQEKV